MNVHNPPPRRSPGMSRPHGAKPGMWIKLSGRRDGNYDSVITANVA